MNRRTGRAAALTTGLLVASTALTAQPAGAAPAHQVAAMPQGLAHLASMALSNQFAFPNGWSGGISGTRGYGNPTDQVLVGDWDGNGTDTIAVRRGNAIFISNNLTSSRADYIVRYGNPGDELHVGDFDGNGTDTFAVRRGDRLFVTNATRPRYADYSFAFGIPSDTYYVGDFDGDGKDTVAVLRGGQKIFVTNAQRSGKLSATMTFSDRAPVVIGRFGGRTDQVAMVYRDHLRVFDRVRSGAATRRINTQFVTKGSQLGDWDGNGTTTPLLRGVKPTQGASYAQELVRLVNAERRKAGVPEVGGSPCGQGFAQRHADRIAGGARFEHQPLKPILDACNFRTVGENLAWGVRGGKPIPASEMVQNWMNSPGHRRNLLSRKFTGLASATAMRSDGGIVGVHVFSG